MVRSTLETMSMLVTSRCVGSSDWRDYLNESTAPACPGVWSHGARPADLRLTLANRETRRGLFCGVAMRPFIRYFVTILLGSSCSSHTSGAPEGTIVFAPDFHVRVSAGCLSTCVIQEDIAGNRLSCIDAPDFTLRPLRSALVHYLPEDGVQLGPQAPLDLKVGCGMVCVLDSERSIHCWSTNGEFDLAGPQASFDLSENPWISTVCSVPLKGQLQCWSAGGSTHVDRVPEMVGRSVSVGGASACATTASGALSCWGFRPDWMDERNSGGGRGTTPRSAFVSWTPKHPPVDVEMSGNIVCTRDRAGMVECQGPYTSESWVVARGAVDMAVSKVSVCVVLRDGSVRCLLVSDTERKANRTPVDIAAPEGGRFVDISCGWTHCCADVDDGSAVCWPNLDAPMPDLSVLAKAPQP